MLRQLLTRNEDLILDALHFVVSYGELRHETELNAETLDEELSRLIAEGIIERLVWDETKKEYLPVEFFDVAIAEKSMSAFHFLATKKGLFLHHSR